MGALSREINLLGALLVTRQRKNIKYEIIYGEELMCLVAIAEHMYGLDRSMFDILRVVGYSLLDTIPIKELFQDIETSDIIEPKQNDGQQTIKFDWS